MRSNPLRRADKLGPNEDLVASGRRDDFLKAHSRIATIAFALALIGLVVGSLVVGVSRHLPGVALGWVFGLQLLRAAVALAIVVALGMFLARAWTGRWPSTLSTTGVEFDALEQATQDLERGARLAMEITRALLEGKK
jgi:hypothetical protein